jgi:tRNA isopentenyl-2-thiomethyl-A-37 hydroxylase MiaE
MQQAATSQPHNQARPFSFDPAARHGTRAHAALKGLWAALQPPGSRAMREALTRQFLTALFRTPEGRAYVFTQAGTAEQTDEGQIFRNLEAKVSDPELLRMVRRHAGDEERHATLFFGCADRQGTPRPNIPSDAHVLPMLDARLGVLGRAMTSDADVLDTYLILQVIEERAVEQFTLMVPIMARFDARSAVVLEGVLRDEERHLKYCRAITRRYAPSEAARLERLRQFREAEAEAYREHQMVSSAHVLDSGFLTPMQTLMWRAAIRALGDRVELPFTRFYGEAEGEAALAA